MKIFEIFNTDFTLTWETHGKFELSKFKYDEHEYVAQIEKKILPFIELTKFKTGEVSFFRNIDDAEAAHSTTNDVGFPAALYGTVANNLATKFKEYDAFYFVVNRRHSNNDKEFKTKKRIYFFLADRIAKRDGAKIYEKNEHGGYSCLISKVNIIKEGFMIEAEEARKSIKMEAIDIRSKK